jgi:hypothetical protein
MSFFKRYDAAVKQKQNDTGMTHGDFYVTPEEVMQDITPVTNSVPTVELVDIVEVTQTPMHPIVDDIMPSNLPELEAKFEKAHRRAARPTHRESQASETKAGRVRNRDHAPSKRSRRMDEGEGPSSKNSKRASKYTVRQQRCEKRVLD